MVYGKEKRKLLTSSQWIVENPLFKKNELRCIKKRKFTDGRNVFLLQDWVVLCDIPRESQLIGVTRIWLMGLFMQSRVSLLFICLETTVPNTPAPSPLTLMDFLVKQVFVL